MLPLQVSALCGHREEPLLAISVLKGVDPQVIQQCKKDALIPLATDWNNAALIYTFCEVR